MRSRLDQLFTELLQLLVGIAVLAVGLYWLQSVVVSRVDPTVLTG